MSEYLSSFYFTVGIQLLLNLAFVIGCIFHFGRIKNLRILFFYSCLTLAQSLLGMHINVYNRRDTEKEFFLDESVHIMVLLEFVFFYRYISKALKSGTSKNILQIIGLIVTFLNIIMWRDHEKLFGSTPFSFSSIAAGTIILLCLYYYYEFFTNITTFSLEKDPPFWSISGMFFLSLMLFPVSLREGETYISQYRISNVYTITFIGYAILYSSFINALRCQIQN